MAPDVFKAMVESKDTVTSLTRVRLTPWGWLALGLTGRLTVETRLFTEHEVGWSVNAEPVVTVHLPGWWERWRERRRPRGPGGAEVLDPLTTRH